jgi:phosphatidylglycerol lysyltransferase
VSATEPATPPQDAAWADSKQAAPSDVSHTVSGATNRFVRWLNSARRWLMPLLSLGIFIGVLHVLHRELEDTSMADVFVYIGKQPLSALFLALVCTAGSYVCRALYDVIGVRLTGKLLSVGRTLAIAFLANAIGQNIGFVVVTAGAIRYRLYTALGLTAKEVGVVIFIATLTALLGLASFAGASLLFTPPDLLRSTYLVEGWRVVGLVLLLAVGGYLFWAVRSRRTFTNRFWSLRPPGARMAWAQAVSACADYVLAAAALWVLLPDSVPISLVAFSAAFSLAALGGSVAGVPGGVGVFESVFLLALPHVPPAELLGALLVYRAIYFLLPLFVASGTLAWQALRTRAANLRRMNDVVGAEEW